MIIREISTAGLSFLSLTPGVGVLLRVIIGGAFALIVVLEVGTSGDYRR